MPKNLHPLRRVFLLGGLIATVLLTLLTGVIQDRNTRELIESRNLVGHTEEVLVTLQRAEQLVREYTDDGLLFRATGQKMYRQREAAERADFSSVILRLTAEVADNPQEEAVAQSLMAEIVAQGTAAGGDTGGAGQGLGEILQFSGKIQQMRATEHRFLTARLEEANRSVRKSVIAAATFLGVTVLMIIGMFLLLWRDAVGRRGLQEQLEEANRHLGAMLTEMQRKAYLSTIAVGAAEELQICIEPRESYGVAARYFSRLAPQSSGALALINNSRQMVETVSTWGERNLFPEVFSLDACYALRSGRKRWHSVASDETPCNHYLATAPPEFYFCLPLAAHGETLGSMLMQFSTPEEFQAAQRDHQALEELGEMVAMAVANLNLRQKLRNQSIRDGLTGLFNRQFLEIAFEREMHRAARNKLPISIFMIDVDHFKQLNDTSGHEAGDAVLRELAQIMLKTVRAEDIVCRYGGEEFVVILPDMPREFAFARAEGLRTMVEQMSVRSGQGGTHQVTVSIGIATYPDDGVTPDKLLRYADENLYRAKRAGRNRTVGKSLVPA